jgi:putative tricarboxylic transport membrane protein
MTADPARVRRARERFRPRGQIVFLGVLAVVFAGYTALAMGLEWRTAGRIGPGFFPRIIGILAVVLCCAATLRRPRAAGRDDGAERTPGRHPWTVVAAVGALAAFLFLLLPLGAFLASALFMAVVFRLLGWRRVVAGLALSLLIPLALYVLFEVVLDAGLPQGVLPLT